MNWTELSRRVAERSGVPAATTRRVLDALLEAMAAELTAGDSVNLPRIGRLSSAWREARAVRSVGDGRKLMLDGRFVPRFRAASALRSQLSARTPQDWKDPRHQAAWRAAETLIGDLALYHGDQAPADLTPDTSPEETERRCAMAFGAHWQRVRRAFDERAPGITAPLLGLVARRRWAR